MTALILIPLLPLVGFLFNGLIGPRLSKTSVGLVACALPTLSFGVTLVLWKSLIATGKPLTLTLFSWAVTSGFALDAAFYFDQVSAVMCLVITGIGTLIHIYSIGYMHDDKSFARYFAYLNLFLFFMLVLVLGKNLLVMFVGWEGVGLASYLLIGFWFDDPAKTAAGVKAFVVNRVGDTGFLLAAFLLQIVVGTLDFQGINAFFTATPPSAAMATLIGVLLLVGACGKSAQIPLHVWLPDAMAGPTPVSALIHAATMVTAGVYLLSRLSGLYVAAPEALQVVAWIGAITALTGATMGVTQWNLKKVLAYSTMSQIGLMVLACGVGAFSVGMFHLVTHAFFKACLFLGAGAILHALGGEEDMRKMGGLAKRLPFTYKIFLIATLALCGLPPFAGFFSKDEILWFAYASTHGSVVLWAIASFASALTAFYMFRLIFITFFGECRVGHEAQHHIHEPPSTMALPLVLLAAGSVLVGFIGLPQAWAELFHVGSPFYSFLEPVLGHAKVRAGIGHSTEWILMGVAVGLALVSIFLAWKRYGNAPVPAPDAPQSENGLYLLVRNGYYFDAFYENFVVRFIGWVSAVVLGRGTEPALTRSTIDEPAHIGATAASGFARLQSGDLQAYVMYALIGLLVALGWGIAYV